MGLSTSKNRTTIQSYYKIAIWQPWGLPGYTNSTPIHMIIAGQDIISKTADQQEVFDAFHCPKASRFATEKRHLDVLGGDGAEKLMAEQASFLEEIFRWRMIALRMELHLTADHYRNCR
jgi:hypothetical protein